MFRKMLALAWIAAVLVGSAIFAAPAAQAGTPRNGVCEAGELCLYYNSNQAGSMVDLASSVKDYGTGSTCIKFIRAGAGRGLCVKNNAASAWNRETTVVTVFRKSGWAGSIDAIAAGSRANLNANLKNDNAGHVVGKTGISTLESGVYHTSAARITAYYDGYISVSGRHEGTDLARGVGQPVYAVVGGTVTYVAEGRTGSGGLSTIAIYNASLNKTVIYLHTDPVNSLRAGQTVATGQKIAVESWRGISSSSAAHTHVEMRLGRQTRAATSVGDPTLSNPNPTQFWIDRGYNICCD